MKIKIYSRGETDIDADGEYQEPVIREAITEGSRDVASTITDYTDSERSNISHDEYAIATEDDGRELWRGWLQGDMAAPAPDVDLRALLDKSTSLLWDTGMPGSRQAAGELRASGGLEAL
jgi:hypothetical protein